MLNRQQIGVGHLQFEKTEREYIQRVMDSGRLSYGPFTKKFEELFASEHQSDYAIFCNSGTSALQVALHALKITHGYHDGDEVLVPALTFVATVNIVLQNNMRPVFVDVDPVYFSIDPTKIEEAITPRTRVIIPVHVGGCPADMDAIMEVAQKHNLQVIEDSCETMFASFNGKRVGSFGNIGCFSTYIAHIITTGVGGLVTTNDQSLAVLMKSLFNHGRDNIYMSIDDDKGKTGFDLKKIVNNRFTFEHVGYSYRATEFEGALGLAQMERWESNIKKRIDNSQRLTESLAGLSKYLQLPIKRPNADHVFMFYPIVVKDGVNRYDLVNYLEENMIETRYLLPLLNQPVYIDMWGDTENNFPVAKRLNHSAFYIASHPALSDDDILYIVATFYRYFKQ